MAKFNNGRHLPEESIALPDVFLFLFPFGYCPIFPQHFYCITRVFTVLSVSLYFVSVLF
jgi:hypothetical protein